MGSHLSTSSNSTVFKGWWHRCEATTVKYLPMTILSDTPARLWQGTYIHWREVSHSLIHLPGCDTAPTDTGRKCHTVWYTCQAVTRHLQTLEGSVTQSDTPARLWHGTYRHWKEVSHSLIHLPGCDMAPTDTGRKCHTVWYTCQAVTRHLHTLDGSVTQSDTPARLWHGTYRHWKEVSHSLIHLPGCDRAPTDTGRKCHTVWYTCQAVTGHLQTLEGSVTQSDTPARLWQGTYRHRKEVSHSLIHLPGCDRAPTDTGGKCHTVWYTCQAVTGHLQTLEGSVTQSDTPARW